MSSVAQIYGIINAVAEQTFGEEAIQAVDTSSFIALGNKILNSENDTEKFTNTLVDRIGRTVFSVRRYEGREGGMVRHPFEYGCIVQKIYVDLPEAHQNNAWEIGNQNYTPTYAPVIRPTVKQKLFDKISTWEIDVTIPDFMLRTAFQNETQMATFIDAIFTAMDNMMNVALENNASLTRASFIARKILGGKPCGAIDVLAKYNELTGANLNRDDALRNTDYLKWVSMQISLWVNRLPKMSSLFNEEGYRRHTPKADMVINVLQDFASATDSFLQADTYHRDLVSLPRYEAVPYWQGSGENYDFDDTSKISVTIGDDTITQDGIIAVIYDYQAMGVTMKERRSSTERNHKDEYTNYYNKANIGYFNDMSENGIVFYMGEGTPVQTYGLLSPNGEDRWDQTQNTEMTAGSSESQSVLYYYGEGPAGGPFERVELEAGQVEIASDGDEGFTASVNSGNLVVAFTDASSIEAGVEKTAKVLVTTSNGLHVVFVHVTFA